ncbi:hypothetical protein Rsub_00634 [Raphidocelis subcapitata]|uniref:RING-type E3 ubiquitin transferase n=1 Tax=Raphidocelis subcapitata TaxID=307507 RepID=A0A2V0NN76_9CHLO|nr:hypothetical protein Rsub_00634 [Raphidocelis subcapitata]|eukprot:GBF87922.1 hypothetical protein Rsub_00634 [Raphidocelis subcapitata]
MLAVAPRRDVSAPGVEGAPCDAERLPPLAAGGGGGGGADRQRCSVEAGAGPECGLGVLRWMEGLFFLKPEGSAVEHLTSSRSEASAEETIASPLYRVPPVIAACTRRVNSVASLGSAGDDADNERSALMGSRGALSPRARRALSPSALSPRARRAVSPRAAVAAQPWLPALAAARAQSPPPACGAAVDAARSLSEALAAAGLAGDVLVDSDGDLDDICPTCLDGFCDANPRIVTRCGHHFHLQCLYSWLERRPTCPLCFAQIDIDFEGMGDS